MNLHPRLFSIVALLGVSALLCLAGCGGGGTTTVTVTSGDEPVSSTEEDGSEESAEELHSKIEDELEASESEEEVEAEQEEAEASEGECTEKGIDSVGLKEGRCTQDGQTVVVVNHDSILRMKTLKVKLLGISKAKTISGEYSSGETASGTYVTFNVEVTNLTHSPVEWEQEQSVLILDENEYSEDFEVQNGNEEASLQWNASEAIQPGNVTTGTVTFDVPTKILKKLYSEGNLDFKNFGEAGYFEEEPKELGIIRTYN